MLLLYDRSDLARGPSPGSAAVASTSAATVAVIAIEIGTGIETGIMIERGAAGAKSVMMNLIKME